MNAYIKDKSEQVDERDYDEWLDEIYEPYEICGTFYASDVLKNCDPIMYETGKSDYANGLDDVWVCSECDAEYESEYDAEDCCKAEESEEE